MIYNLNKTIILSLILTLTVIILIIGAIGAHADQVSTNLPKAAIRIIPTPQDISWNTRDEFSINAKTRIVINSHPDEKDRFTAAQLQRKIWDVTGYNLKIVQSKTGAPTNNVIAIGSRSGNRAVASHLKHWKAASGKKPKTEGYILGINKDAVVIAGFDQAGTFYGCQTLIQIIERFGKNRIDGLFCYDYPDMPWRGTMVRVRGNFDVDYTKEVVSEIMARYKLNVIEFHISYGTIWPSHPELYYDRKDREPNPSSLAQVKQVADFARKHFMEVIPTGPSWTHSWEWQTAEDMNSDLLESPNAGGTAENLCPCNPKAQKLMHDLLQDEIDAFHPKYINMGWDEIGSIGECQYCKGEDPVTLFTEFLKNDRDYLASKGIKMLMWADMLRQDQNGGEPWNLYKAVSKIPKDIILCDWFYTGHHTDFPSLNIWNENGLQSLGAPYGVYPPGIENIYSWCQAAKRHSILGVVAFNKYRCGSKQTSLNNPDELACFPFIGEWSWSADKPNFDPAPYNGAELVRAQSSPDVPTEFKASMQDGKVTLSWRNPPETKLQATWICFRTDRFPTDPRNGKLVADVSGSANSRMTYTHPIAPTNGKVYYAAFSHDKVRHFSPAAVTVLSRP
ncbi:glycoside hydrolase family 20 zincin-like fold domain-containing protein [uncultured Desulfobulbus sp.]|uniref:glycoside hydrolase family 20 zincin-like fold domain-containing protein n=1 Tax=uncultured Desulfobulbus sp. TaxID=239745 RepID=UPI0029C6842F|nr:glycoside hydrolase family 20 zincin-like fold domain-containing protein [uncultured Desulfobulbus sp.]